MAIGYYVFFFNVWLHSAFILGLVFFIAWHGANRYHKMMTKFYEIIIQKLIEEFKDRQKVSKFLRKISEDNLEDQVNQWHLSQQREKDRNQ